MKLLCKIAAFAIVIAAFGVGIWCFSLISEQREASDNMILIGIGVFVPLLTFYSCLPYFSSSKT